jgi:putative ABC transport system permease protein
VAIVSETLARRYWPDEDPVGRRVRVGDVAEGPRYTIVGVVADARYLGLDAPDVRPMLYFSALARPEPGMTLVTRGASAGALAEPLRRIVASLDPALPAPAPRALDALIGLETAARRFALVLFAIFGGTALLLVAVGIYGVMSYLVRQRTFELGVRIALGAPRATLVASVVGGALGLTAAGIALGLLGAWALTGSLSALLYGVSATDPATFAAIALLLAVVAALASLLPARRATRTDPLVALRSEA